MRILRVIGPCYVQAMKGRYILGYFLTFFAIGGLALTPIARPAMAMPGAQPAPLGELMTAASMAPSAMDDMPCCPGKPSLPACAKDCPFMPLCGAMPLQGVSQSSLIVPLALVNIIFPNDQSALASVARPPPRKPPKI
jgi:hypothetical protein